MAAARTYRQRRSFPETSWYWNREESFLQTCASLSPSNSARMRLRSQANPSRLKKQRCRSRTRNCPWLIEPTWPTREHSCGTAEDAESPSQQGLKRSLDESPQCSTRSEERRV